MFSGEFEHSIDQKGRIAIPARFRERFREGIVLVRGFDLCAVAYPKGEWDKMAERMATLPSTRANYRRLNRSFFGGSNESELDRQGRVVLPQALRNYARIGNGAIIVGVNSYLEIWSTELWAQEKAAAEAQGWQIAETIEVR